jgi:DNA-binding transcriptional MocR family regulator
MGTIVQPLLQWENSITYSERVFVASGSQRAMSMRHIVICDLPGSTIFFHIIS